MWACGEYLSAMLLVLGVLLGFATSIVVSKSHEVQLFCPSHNPQKTLDISLLMGRWHVVEIVDHMPRDGLRLLHEIPIEACPVVELRQEDPSNIRLMWTEDGRTVYYHAQRTDISSPGFWIASGPHAEYEAEYDRRHYPFSGTVEVMKAVRDHVVLTFCKSDHADSQLFSAVLAKDQWLPRSDTLGINRMLTSRRLDPKLIKRTCSGASTITVPALLTLIVGTLWLI